MSVFQGIPFNLSLLILGGLPRYHFTEFALLEETAPSPILPKLRLT
jgi:hypothetical protein